MQTGRFSCCEVCDRNPTCGVDCGSCETKAKDCPCGEHPTPWACALEQAIYIARLRSALDEIAMNAEGLLKGGLPHFSRKEFAETVAFRARHALGPTPPSSENGWLELEAADGGRGLLIVRFEDLYGEKCSIQKSSLATQDAIWLGQHQCSKCDAPTRMHLSRGMAASLASILQCFADTGELMSSPTVGADGGGDDG